MCNLDKWQYLLICLIVNDQFYEENILYPDMHK